VEYRKAAKIAKTNMLKLETLQQLALKTNYVNYVMKNWLPTGTIIMIPVNFVVGCVMVATVDLVSLETERIYC